MTEYQVHMLSRQEDDDCESLGDEWIVVEANSEKEACKLAESEEVRDENGLDPDLTWYADQADELG